MRYDDATRAEIHAAEMAAEALAARASRNAAAVELLSYDPINYVQYSLFSDDSGRDDTYHCVLILESRSEVELLVPRTCLQRIEAEQVDYVENEGQEFFLWIGGLQIKCSVEAITYVLEKWSHVKPS